MVDFEKSVQIVKLYFALVSLIEIAEDRKREVKNAVVSKLQYVKEFCTIKLCTARGGGHSAALAELIRKKYNKVVIMFPSLRIAENFISHYHDIKDKITICTPDRLEQLFGIQNHEAAFVDCCSLVSQSKIDKFIEITCPCMADPLYVFLE
jgi:hypothetical protein